MCDGFVKPHLQIREHQEKHWFQQWVQQETGIIQAETTPLPGTSTPSRHSGLIRPPPCWPKHAGLLWITSHALQADGDSRNQLSERLLLLSG